MRRFYTDVAVTAAPFRILLDGQPVRTPAHAELIAPTAALVEAIAQEWRTQGETIDPAAMPHLKLANTAIDRVAPVRAAVAGQVMTYLNDLLCYRAERPSALAVLQATEWDPLLDWVQERYGVRLKVRPGIVHFDQPEPVVTALTRAVAAFEPFPLTALAAAAPILGSLVLTFALAEGRLDAAAAFALSQLDERYQAERWGRDEEAAARAAGLLEELKTAERFLKLSSPVIAIA